MPSVALCRLSSADNCLLNLSHKLCPRQRLPLPSTEQRSWLPTPNPQVGHHHLHWTQLIARLSTNTSTLFRNGSVFEYLSLTRNKVGTFLLSIARSPTSRCVALSKVAPLWDSNFPGPHKPQKAKACSHLHHEPY